MPLHATIAIPTSRLGDLLDHIGVEDIIPRDNEIQARCPLHEKRMGQREHNPRHWSINVHTGVHHCFSCGYKGGLTQLVMDVTGKGIWDAQRTIHQFSVSLQPYAALSTEPEEYAEPRQTLLERLQSFSEPPERAMRRRKLTEASVAHYGVRWDDEDNAWILPIHSENGDLWGWQSKTKDRVLNHPNRVKKSHTLFGLDVLIEEQTADPANNYTVVVESPLDCLYLYELGYPAVAVFGSTMSEFQRRLILQCFETVILALDNDLAGINGTRQVTTTRLHHHISVQTLNYEQAGGAKDPGEMSPKEFHAAMQTAIPVYHWPRRQR
jgi:DNA primase